MTELGPAQPAPTKEELLARLAKPLAAIVKAESSDTNDSDWFWILRRVNKAYLYYRDLAYFAPSLFQGIVDATGIDGTLIPDSNGFQGVYDYTQNIYKGYCRKLEAVLGTRIPNAVAVPNDPTSEKDQTAARAANDAAQYIRQACDLQSLILWLVFSLFNFGTSFWHLDWLVDGDRFGWKEVPQEGMEDLTLGADDPAYGGGFGVQAPAQLPPKRVAKGGLVIEILNASEVRVPLETPGRDAISQCLRVRREREVHKAKLLRKYPNLRQILKDSSGNDEDSFDVDSASAKYARSVRSAMASPIGIVRPQAENLWTEAFENWPPDMYELAESDEIRELLKTNFPDGLRWTTVKGKLVDLAPEVLVEHWQECQPEPTERIMGEPLGDDFMVTQDLCNNLLNQQNEAVERSNMPALADPNRIDFDAWQRRRDRPGDLIPAIPPAGKSLSDIMYQLPQIEYSEQIPAFRAQVEETSKNNSGLTDPIWGGDTSDPTARQTELKTNAAIRQLGVIWVMMGKSLEQVYLKGCKLLAAHEDGVLSFAKKNQFGKFDSVAIAMEDLRSGEFHFEADEAIPMTWGQQRDLLMWMLDKPPEILEAWGLGDPLNIYEFKELLGMPGMRTPHLDDRDKGLAIIGRLLEEQSLPGEPDPATGAPGPPQPSIPPDWEDDPDFMSRLAKAYLTVNFRVQESNPSGYQNVQLWGQAHEANAQKVPPEPPKTSVTLALKGEDIGPDATTAALTKSGIEPEGVQAVQAPMPKLLDPNMAMKTQLAGQQAEKSHQLAGAKLAQDGEKAQMEMLQGPPGGVQ